MPADSHRGIFTFKFHNYSFKHLTHLFRLLFHIDKKKIKRIHKKSKELYGFRRITKDLRKHKIKCSKNRVHRLMNLQPP
ncbi:IS3 family transposase [Desulfitobacterium metallireducens]|uniref:IS3 family transposase n=1 Tax=Desulfitobacterium metallireducens TaxID=142877 RepID=UPI000A06C3D2